MLCLTSASKPEWVQVAVSHPDEILIDHAHCEKKAAAFAMSMIGRYPQHTSLVKHMIAIAQEELEHFEIVVGELEKRNLQLTADNGNHYANQLRQHVRTGKKSRLLDLLIVGAFIEARSCERFSLLADHVRDAALATLYKSLLASEAGHYRVYTDIAREYFPADVVKTRLQEYAEYEANIVAQLPNNPTMHG